MPCEENWDNDAVRISVGIGCRLQCGGDAFSYAVSKRRAYTTYWSTSFQVLIPM